MRSVLGRGRVFVGEGFGGLKPDIHTLSLKGALGVPKTLSDVGGRSLQGVVMECGNVVGGDFGGPALGHGTYSRMQAGTREEADLRTALGVEATS